MILPQNSLLTALNATDIQAETAQSENHELQEMLGCQ